MNYRIALSLSAIALASSLVSCSSGNEVAPDASPTIVAPVETAPVATVPPAPDVSPGSEPGVTKAPDPVMTTDSVRIPSGQDAPTDNSDTTMAVVGEEIADGPAKSNALYVFRKIAAHLAAGGEATTPNCVDAVAGDMAEFDDRGQISCMYEENGSYTLHSWHPDDENYKDFNTGLRHNSVSGFKK